MRHSLGLLVLLACSSARPAGPANVGVGPAPTRPAAIAVQLAYRESFMVGPPFTRIPPFTLLDDGTLLDVDEKTSLVYATQLSKAEADRIVRHVRDLGFDKLENRTGSCKDIANRHKICVSDATFTVLRVGHREVTTYADFSNQPAVFTKLVDYLSHYRHAPGRPYLPEKAAVHSSIVAVTPPLPCKAIDPAILKRRDSDPDGAILEGDALRALLAIAPNHGKVRVCGGGKVFDLTIVPAIPGVDLAEEIKFYHRK